jgi:two-component sensor histidine kinase
VELHELIKRELAPHETNGNSRITVRGEVIWLPPHAAVALGMALHELASNAARHGALSSLEGQVDVSWTLSHSERGIRVQLVWQETRGPLVREPTRRGFGSRMIESGLAHELEGSARLYFEPTGLRCVIDANLPAQVRAA